ncbi:MAG: hypothetical protein NTY41_01040, partial [Proteobacteria bacterium]|nr:hypothetical protein [Pseudomonadota bacterium]
PASSVSVHSNSPEFENLDLLSPRRDFHFVPTSGWQGHIELGNVTSASYSQSKLESKKQLTEERTY